ncbi:MAG: sensor histidine kinase, partial [Actinomycetota bacterium]
MTSPQEYRGSHRSVRTLLLWLVLALLLPGLGGVGFLLLVEYQKERARLEMDTVQMARALSQVVDDRIAQTQTLAQGLANADSLAAGNLAGFYKVARRTLEQTGFAIDLVVSDRSAQQVLNTAQSWGTPLPRHGNPQVIERVFETGSPAVSNLFTGAVTRRQIMTVAVPVVARDRLSYVLNIAVLPTRFKEVLDAQSLPEGWVSSVFDGNGVIVARTQSPGASVGKQVPTEFLEHIKNRPEGAVDVVSPEGIPMHAYYSVSPTTGWGVAVAVPQRALAAQSGETLAFLALGMVALLGIGLALAWMIGGRIAKSIQALKEPAAALGAGHPIALPKVHVREANEVVKALELAAQVLEERTGELLESNRTLQAREAEIERLNALLERRVEERTAELQAANRELEGFTYAVSHDLRAPMGRIASFSTLLEQQYRSCLEGNGLLFLDFIRQNANRLIQLVDDLLNHARVGRQDLALGPMAISTLVQMVLREQAEAINDLRALIKLSFAPATVLSDSYSMTQALGNLLQNALKFSATARPPIIEIGGQELEGRYVLWVKDNGIGFDMAYHDKIFEMF